MNSLKTEVVINASIETVFAFFSKAENLEQLTPQWLRFKILTPLPVIINKDSLITYRIKLFYIPMRWKTKITDWEPPHRFTDVQLKGPYKTWIHEHRFIAQGNKTKMTDIVHYEVPGLSLIHI